MAETERRKQGVGRAAGDPPFTPRQGQYLAYIRDYTRLHRQPPSEAEMAAHFGVTPPTVHAMIVTLEKRGLIERTPHRARSLRLKVAPEALPVVEQLSPGLFSERYPHLMFWVTEQGRIELGYDPNTDTWARALDEGGMAWGGGTANETVEEWLTAMEAGVKEFRGKWEPTVLDSKTTAAYHDVKAQSSCEEV